MEMHFVPTQATLYVEAIQGATLSFQLNRKNKPKQFVAGGTTYGEGGDSFDGTSFHLSLHKQFNQHNHMPSWGHLHAIASSNPTTARVDVWIPDDQWNLIHVECSRGNLPSEIWMSFDREFSGKNTLTTNYLENVDKYSGENTLETWTGKSNLSVSNFQCTFGLNANGRV